MKNLKDIILEKLIIKLKVLEVINLEEWKN